MAQQLIVEGNDAIVLANILKKRQLNPPKGYSDPNKFTNRFVKQAGSISKVNTVLEIALNRSDINNLGIIVDANQVGVGARLDSLLATIASTLDIEISRENAMPENAFIWQAFPDFKIGIWIMPNNQDTGYLEHFLTELIPQNDETFQFAKEKVDELIEKDYCNFTPIKKQKALLHTYLAWQQSPGLPMGTAVQSNYLNASLAAANNFENWFKAVFELES